MTTQKYKVGDEVLVRANISSISDDKYYIDDSYDLYHLEKDIYSLAPEFDYKEEIEVSDDKINWFKAKFLFTSMDTDCRFIVNCPFPSRYNYARKIQPQKDQHFLMFEGKKYKLVEE